VATTQADIATTQASTATAQASIATAQAGISITQAGISTTKAAEASASATSAASSYDQFDDRYLGSKSSPPTVDNDGNPLLVGALYFNSVTLNMNVWGGSSWSATYIPVSGYAPLANPNFTGQVTENGSPVVVQTDIGTAPNEIPLNQYLGSLAYQDLESVTIDGGVATLDTATITSIQNDTAISNVEPSLMLNFAAVEALDPRITYARASTATYYDGVTNSKAEQNLLTYSQEFDNASWTKTNATVTANTTVAPDGTTTADKVAASVTTTTSVRVNQASFSTTSGTSYILSVFAKKDDIDFILLLDATTNKGKYFNLDTGVVGADEGGAPAASSITSFGNGWYRCTITITASTTLGARIYISSADATIGYAATTGQGLYIWGAQIEQRDAVTAYTPTTTQPITLYQPTLLTAPSGVARFDHNPTTTESLGLLIEEQRTNLLLYSEQFDNAYWTKVDSTITANTIVAPDGTLTGDKLVEVVAVGQAGVQRDLGNQTGSFSWSIYAKAGERSWLSLIAYASAANRTWFNLSNGTVGTNASGNTASIVPVGNGWYKCTVSRTLSGTQNVLFIAKIATGDNIISYTGDGYSGIYIWGAQLEASSFSTSYIPTVASQVTRSADSASMTGANFSSWYRADEGTVYGEWLNNGAVSGKFPKAYNISDGTNNNTITRFADVQFSANAMSVTTNSVLQAFINAGAPSNNTNYKFADVYKVNDFAACVNAGTVGVDTNGIVPVVNQITIGADAAGSNRMSGHIKKLSYFPARLSNEELQEMTS